MRAGCDAVFLDLHGAMVIEDCDDAEGEIVQRLRRIAPRGADRRHARLSHQPVGTLVDNATVITGYKTYPHVDMYEAGMLAGGILVGALDGAIEPVMAWGWKPLLASIMRHAPEDGPSGDILALREAHGGRRHGARRDAVAIVSRMPIRRSPACRRSSSATRGTAAASTRRRCARTC